MVPNRPARTRRFARALPRPLRLLDQPTPAEHDATGNEYTFEKGVRIEGPAPSRRQRAPASTEAAGTEARPTSPDSGAGVPARRTADRQTHGFADVWWRGKFAWEYKRKDKYKDLADAYRQLCQYREALENPPLLIVSDIARTEIHTNFTGTAKQVHVVELQNLAEPESLDLLRRVFTEPASFKPELTRTSPLRESHRHL